MMWGKGNWGIERKLFLMCVFWGTNGIDSKLSRWGHEARWGEAWFKALEIWGCMTKLWSCRESKQELLRSKDGEEGKRVRGRQGVNGV
jgi:hypothetical protein